MCFCFKNKIKKWYARMKMNKYEKHLHDCDLTIRKHENYIKNKNKKRLETIIEFETNKLYSYEGFR
jgi:hypothetical protein